MVDRLTRRKFAGMPLGLLAALVSCVGSVIAAWDVALSLQSIRSFSEIAKPSSFAVGLGVLAAVLAVVTMRNLDRDQR